MFWRQLNNFYLQLVQIYRTKTKSSLKMLLRVDKSPSTSQFLLRTYADFFLVTNWRFVLNRRLLELFMGTFWVCMLLHRDHFCISYCQVWVGKRHVTTSQSNISSSVRQSSSQTIMRPVDTRSNLSGGKSKFEWLEYFRILISINFPKLLWPNKVLIAHETTLHKTHNNTEILTYRSPYGLEPYHTAQWAVIGPEITILM